MVELAQQTARLGLRGIALLNAARGQAIEDTEFLLA